MSAPPAFLFTSYPATASASANDSASGYAAGNILFATEYNGWMPSDTTGDKILTIDLGTAQVVDSIGLAGLGLDGVNCEVRGSTDNFGSSDVQLSATATLSGSIAAWVNFANLASYRYLKLIFDTMGSDFMVAYACCTAARVMPWLEDGHDPDIYQTTGSHLISPSGVVLGSVQQSTLRDLSLGFGQVNDSDYQKFADWAATCVATLRPWFYVPDSSAAAVYFGWTEASYKFSAPYRSGLRTMAKIPFKARVG